MVKDLVCGMDVEENKAEATSNYQGETYSFCSADCKEQFGKSPEQYVKPS